MVAAIYSGSSGALDRLKVERIGQFHEWLLPYLHSEKRELMEKIAAGSWDDAIESELSEAIAAAVEDFGPDFDAEGNPLEDDAPPHGSGGAQDSSSDQSRSGNGREPQQGASSSQQEATSAARS
jgi:hypothetical protein